MKVIVKHVVDTVVRLVGSFLFKRKIKKIDKRLNNIKAEVKNAKEISSKSYDEFSNLLDEYRSGEET